MGVLRRVFYLVVDPGKSIIYFFAFPPSRGVLGCRLPCFNDLKCWRVENARYKAIRLVADTRADQTKHDGQANDGSKRV